MNWKFFLNNKGFFTVVDVIIGAAIGFGAAEGIGALTSNPKQPASPTAPSTTTAAATATAAQTSQRQAALSSGGQTNVTSGSGIILGQDVSSVSLVGSS